MKDYNFEVQNYVDFRLTKTEFYPI
jgi:hypothetical protein